MTPVLFIDVLDLLTCLNARNAYEIVSLDLNGWPEIIDGHSNMILVFLTSMGLVSILKQSMISSETTDLTLVLQKPNCNFYSTRTEKVVLSVPRDGDVAFCNMIQLGMVVLLAMLTIQSAVVSYYNASF